MAANFQYVFGSGEVKILRKTRGTITKCEDGIVTVRPVLGRFDVLIPLANLESVSEVNA